MPLTFVMHNMDAQFKVIVLMLIFSYSTTGAHAQCQAQSVDALKSMLLAAGGTLNPQVVAVDVRGARLFKSHVIKQIRNRVPLSDSDDDERDHELESEDEDIEQRENLSDDYHDDDEKRIHRRKRRSTTLGNCYSPGIPVNNKYILCHTCDSTTILSTDYFPRYINEVICNPNRASICFQGQGSCSSNSVPTVFLKKSGQCVPSGNGILLEEWLPVNLNVRTCCECTLLPGSFLIPWT